MILAYFEATLLETKYIASKMFNNRSLNIKNRAIQWPTKTHPSGMSKIGVSKGYLIVRVCRSGGPAGHCALGENGGGAKEVNPSTTTRVDNYEVLRDCLGDGTYVSQSPRRVVQGSLGRMEGKTHTHTLTHQLSNPAPQRKSFKDEIYAELIKQGKRWQALIVIPQSCHI